MPLVSRFFERLHRRPGGRDQRPANRTKEAAGQCPHTEVLLLDEKPGDERSNNLRNRHQRLHQANDHALAVACGPGCDQAGEAGAKYGATECQERDRDQQKTDLMGAQG